MYVQMESARHAPTCPVEATTKSQMIKEANEGYNGLMRRANQSDDPEYAETCRRAAAFIKDAINDPIFLQNFPN